MSEESDQSVNPFPNGNERPAESGQRDPSTGQWVRGNNAAKGRRTPQKAAALRALFYEVLTPDRFRAAITAMLREVLANGNVAAFKELADRSCGRVPLAEAEEADAPTIIRTPLAVPQTKPKE